MSNAPSLKEPSMEEILASIRRIIESGDEKSKPQGDILHDEPASSHGHEDHAHGDGPTWEFGSLSRDFAPANGDTAPVVHGVGSEDGDAQPEGEATCAAGDAAPEAPAGVFVAEMPEQAELADPVVLEAPPASPSLTPRVPRREAMPRRTDMPRDGLSLSSAYRREPLATADPVAPQADEVPEARYDDLVAVEPDEAIASVADIAPEPVAAVHPPGLADRIADTVSADFATGFDEEQFSSDLRVAVGLDAPAPESPAEPSVIAAASTLMSEAAGAQVAAAFDDLARAIRDGQMKSMEDMAREMLRPMLQEWLDDNLPRIVERMVREEIERVSRGPRR